MTRLTTAGRTGRLAGGALLATLALLTVAGCGGSGEDSGDAAAGAGTGKTESPDSRADDNSKSPSPSPTVTAADGTDTGACADGNCEITVSKPVTFDIKIPAGPTKLSVTKVGKNEVGFKVTHGTSKNGGSTSGTASGKGNGCTTYFHSNGSGTQCGAAGGPPTKEVGTVALQVVPSPDGTAILRLVSP